MNIIMLTCDAFGLMPPVARLSVDQAVFHFLTGYTAKVAGTEQGVKEPQATFSPCFGAPFMALPPVVYADLLRKKVEKHQAVCWLVNTGWSGKPAGEAPRIRISHSRAIVKAILKDAMEEVEYHTDPVFGLRTPNHVEGVPPEILNPGSASGHEAAYDQRARKLAADFEENFEPFRDHVPEGVVRSMP